MKGTLVKYATNGTVNVGGTIVCSTSSYHPAVFTSQDDDSAGEQIAGSSGSPSALASCYGLIGDGDFHDLHFCYIGNAINPNYGSTLAIVQFIHCPRPISSQVSVSATNCLFYDFTAIFTAPGSAGWPVVQFYNSTASSGSYAFDIFVGTFAATNCIFANISNVWCGVDPSWLSGDYNGFYNADVFGSDQFTNNSTPFQSGAFGNFYLTTNCAFRNQGTTNIDAGLLSSLQQKTTYPPVVHVSESITNETTYSQTAQRDLLGDGLDLGYHYDPLDHVFAGCDAYQNITFTSGTAVGWYRVSSGWYHAGHGIHLDDQKICSFDGTFDQPCYWVRTETVQEGEAVSLGAMVRAASRGGPIKICKIPRFRLRFT